MTFDTHICRRLHEEHAAVFELCRRMEQAFSRQALPPAADEVTWHSLFTKIEQAMEHEVWKHFNFEERALWPLLDASGDGELAQLLDEEHEVIREVAEELTSGITLGRSGEFDPAAWRKLKTAALEFSERLVSHAQKEDLSLLPVLDKLLTPEQDNELFGAYAMA
ncbi:MAG: hemerythrin domain-containing protein [Betaproteobacteria bacterium]|nr:hemerythrin domain-containing protein [Betaproteobacteria bacterium]